MPKKPIEDWRCDFHGFRIWLHSTCIFTNGERVARDYALAYPTVGKAIGNGPIEGQVIGVIERDEKRDRIEMQSPDGRCHLIGKSDGITIT